LISIIIPTLNEEACLGKTLDNLLAARGEFEVLVVDGGSNDATLSIASRYCRTITLPRGRALQMNRGAEEARGEVLLFLHADVLFPRLGLLSIDKAMEDRRVVGGNFDLVFEGNEGERSLAARVFTLINRWRRPFGIFYGDSGIFVRTEIFRALGGYRPTPLMEDYDFARRLVRRGKTVCVKDALLVSSRRWEEHGLFRTLAAWFFLHTAYLLGVPARYLAPFYPPIRRRLRSYEEALAPAPGDPAR
jgi:rSAM/selenodomain-associated transferase 2